MKTSAKTIVQHLFNLFIIVFFVATIITSLGYNAKARLIPLVIALPCLAMILYQFAADLLGKQKKKGISVEEELFLKTMEKVHQEVVVEKKEKKTDREATLALLNSVGWILAFVILVYLFGFLITIPLFSVIYMRAKGDSWVLSISVAAGLWLTTYLAFIIFAKISLYDALIFRLLEE